MNEGHHGRVSSNERRQARGEAAEEGVVGRREEVDDESGTVDLGAFRALEISKPRLKQQHVSRRRGFRGAKLGGVDRGVPSPSENGSVKVGAAECGRDLMELKLTGPHWERGGRAKDTDANSLGGRSFWGPIDRVPSPVIELLRQLCEMAAVGVKFNVPFLMRGIAAHAAGDWHAIKERFEVACQEGLESFQLVRGDGLSHLQDVDVG